MKTSATTSGCSCAPRKWSYASTGDDSHQDFELRDLGELLVVGLQGVVTQRLKKEFRVQVISRRSHVLQHVHGWVCRAHHRPRAGSPSASCAAPLDCGRRDLHDRTGHLERRQPHTSSRSPDVVLSRNETKSYFLLGE